MDDSDQLNFETRYYEALQLFQDLWLGATLENIFGILRRKPTFLCNFDGIRRDLNLHTSAYRGLQEISIKQIVGSVGRDQDFTRHFRPRRRNMRSRWAGVYASATSPIGLPPIKLYQVCDSYFVLDGHHRVSVAYNLKIRTIEAEIITFSTNVCLPTVCL